MQHIQPASSNRRLSDEMTYSTVTYNYVYVHHASQIYRTPSMMQNKSVLLRILLPLQLVESETCYVPRTLGLSHRYGPGTATSMYFCVSAGDVKWVWQIPAQSNFEGNQQSYSETRHADTYAGEHGSCTVSLNDKSPLRIFLDWAGCNITNDVSFSSASWRQMPPFVCRGPQIQVDVASRLRIAVEYGTLLRSYARIAWLTTSCMLGAPAGFGSSCLNLLFKFLCINEGSFGLKERLPA